MTVPMSWYDLQENDVKFTVASCRPCRFAEDYSTVKLCSVHVPLAAQS